MVFLSLIYCDYPSSPRAWMKQRQAAPIERKPQIVSPQVRQRVGEFNAPRRDQRPPPAEEARFTAGA
jgi:hypothetical protein